MAALIRHKRKGFICKESGWAHRADFPGVRYSLFMPQTVTKNEFHADPRTGRAKGIMTNIFSPELLERSMKNATGPGFSGLRETL